ncbi:MAG: low specificity L-threonine aldolase [Alphaproteobacteria bacterium]|jgi:threonine aldolase|nr:low specificity L-threonine aldolase [Alphaproteobacteria bacterium]
MNFKSDNVVPASPEIVQAIQDANKDTQSSYGADTYSAAATKKLSEIFEKEVIVYFTNTGTAANSLALSALVNPHEVIYCHEESHINTDECGAPEFFTGGSKLIPCSGPHGKLDLDLLNEKILQGISMRPHAQKPGCISITQATECGTVYTLQELHQLHTIAKEHHLPIHMDGARFTNSLIKLGCTPAELTWKTGVDVMSFGATKNGTVCAEAIIFFNHNHAKDFDYLHKRSGQLMSKTRFFACQLTAYLAQDLWLKNAKHANAMAQNLVRIFQKNGVEIVHPVESNEIFVKLPSQTVTTLREQACGFYDWGATNSDLYRFVTSFHTSNSDIEGLDKCLSKITLQEERTV